MVDNVAVDPAFPCPMCRKESTMTCKNCHEIQYCSEECQKLDIPIHKLLCNDWDPYVDLNHRQHPEVVRALHFSERDTRPGFIWIKPKLHEDGSIEIIRKSVIDDLGGLKTLGSINKTAIEYLDRPLNKSIIINTRLVMDENSVRKPEGGVPTKAFEQIDKELVECLNGPLLAYGFNMAERKFVDLGMADFRYTVDYFRVERDRRKRIEHEPRPHLFSSTLYLLNVDTCTSQAAYRSYRSADFSLEEKIRGVPVNCSGDIAILGCDRFEEIDTNIHEAGQITWDSPAAAKIGVPLLIATVKPGLSWRGRREFYGSSAMANWVHSILTCHEICDSSLYRTHTLQERDDYLLNRGTMLVTRKDRLPLSRLHLMAITEYLDSKFHEYLSTTSRDKTGPATSLEGYLACISQNDFMKFFEERIPESGATHP